MASSSTLFQRVVQLFGRGYTKSLQIINKIRSTISGKYITVANIKKNIATYQAAKASAKAIGSLDKRRQIGGVLSKASGKDKDTVRAFFHFKFTFQGRTSSGRQGRQDVHLSVDLPDDTSKAALMNKLKELADDWINQNYTSDTEGRSSIRVVIDILMGV